MGGGVEIRKEKLIAAGFIEANQYTQAELYRLIEQKRIAATCINKNNPNIVSGLKINPNDDLRAYVIEFPDGGSLPICSYRMNEAGAINGPKDWFFKVE